MVVRSLVRQGYKLREIEVVVKLMPGLPSVQILGLPDQSIKESAVRLRSAFRSLNLPFPKAQTVVVDLKPTYLKKTSSGVDFAIATALLWELKVFEPPKTQPLIYGELNLDGTVQIPNDIEDYLGEKDLWTGTSPPGAICSMDRWEISSLLGLSAPCFQPASQQPLCKPTPGGEEKWEFSPELIELMAVIATGEHPTLFAGSHGVGKTTVAKSIHRSLPAIPNSLMREVRSIHRLDGRDISVRPLVAPHHTATAISIVGGGSASRPGDVSRAHGGTLLLDEYLQFQGPVLESLREPFESGEIRVGRNLRSTVYPARSLILATTNLCPCGKWMPGKAPRCSYSMRRCRSQLERLSGPMLDRFAGIVFLEKPTSEGSGSIEELCDRVKQARGAARKRKQSVVNQRLGLSQLMAQLEAPELIEIVPQLSHRRTLSLFRVARTYADLKGDEKITRLHLQKAEGFAVAPFEKLFAETAAI